jgi:cytochrome c-type biogenesis protein CcmH/NrfG
VTSFPTVPEPEPGSRSDTPRTRRTNPLVIVGVLVFALVVYFVIIGIRGFYLLAEHRWDLKVLGVAVLVLPLVGVWVTVAELRFGRASQRLAERMREEGESLDLPELPRRPSGRVDRSAADAWFEQQRERVEADSDDWRGWFRLAQAYDLSGDRKRAREALRTAIALSSG